LLAKPSATQHAGVANLLANSSTQIYVVAVTIGSVFFGANTYIGNGPNFMVKSIADQQKVQTPDFLTYIFKYTLPFMAPMLLLVWWIYFSR
jgi:Na+/H+ antiporter NhaD/arsenite permease-like protein